MLTTPKVISSIDNLKERQSFPRYLTRYTFKQWLKDTHTTQKQVSEATGISANKLSCYINGYKGSHDLAESLAEYVNQVISLPAEQFMVPDYLKYVAVSDLAFKRPRCADARPISITARYDRDEAQSFLWEQVVFSHSKSIPLECALGLCVKDEAPGNLLGVCVGEYTHSMYDTGIPSFTECIPVDFVMVPDSSIRHIGPLTVIPGCTSFILFIKAHDDPKVHESCDGFLHNNGTLKGMNLFFTKPKHS